MNKREFDAVVAITFGLFIVLVVALSIWVRTSVPCNKLGWLPVKDVPARCLMHR
jgi:hypothetical protein